MTAVATHLASTAAARPIAPLPLPAASATRRPRLVPAGHPAAVKRRGPVPIGPGPHRAITIPAHGTHPDPPWGDALAHDGVHLTVSGTARAQMGDSPRHTTAHASRVAAIDTAEHKLRRFVSQRHPAGFARLSGTGTTGERARCPGHEPRHRARGHHDRRCRHPADRDSPLRPGFIRRAQSSTIARPGPCPSARRDEENPTMDINRTTVPGTGSLHHFTTRADRRFAVLAHPDGRRTLIIYHDGPPDSDDPDAPAQHIELDVDEADQLAEVLHSRSLLDRIARLEHRLAQLTGHKS